MKRLLIQIHGQNIDKLKLKKFDIVINLNITFNPDIDMFIDKMKAKYKIGFVSKYSDFFYNIQINWDGTKSRFNPIISILGQKILYIQYLNIKQKIFIRLQ